MMIFACLDSNNGGEPYVTVGESQDTLWDEIAEQVVDSMKVELPDNEISSVLRAVAETAELEAMLKVAFKLGIQMEKDRLRKVLSI